jgi:hypothetical protein
MRGDALVDIGTGAGRLVLHHLPPPRPPAGRFRSGSGDMSAVVARRIGKTLALLGSPEDGEALAAARALGRLLEGAGMDHHALAALVTAEIERRGRPAFTFAALPVRMARKQMGFLAWRSGATDLDRARLERMRARLLGAKTLALSAEEIAWLDALWRQANGAG